MKALILMITLITITLLSACNTLSGIGKDVKKGGQAIEKSAN
ncbi:Predicted small secreted protein [Nitrosomonas ureae]|uniref:Predicted small secreted protein n=1 Tax=Nitrosomonas ureae TaxID=44577 RepID=A0A1H9D962_9PROT|nr:entericidin A/B family lipoprotein [Nitrosomonas ureae]PTQ84069.1 putative small secreted protein [Nitrosomonas ureae]PXX11867.1 putative small secreted protein [Nitrosomonas ureae]SDU20152.1 Predicted small secreted protein [Nitrosomonas ureae]SEQ10025.1 Predicted small secreted protein [Nitrosomonas ureae]